MEAPPPAQDAGPKQAKEEKAKKGFKRYKYEFKSSNLEFWKAGHAVVKILSLVNWMGIAGVSVGRFSKVRKTLQQLKCMYFPTQVLMLQALLRFDDLAAHPIIILLLSMELSILSFFIMLYSFAINRYMPFIFWPVAVSKNCREGGASHILAPAERNLTSWRSAWEAGLEKGSQEENAPRILCWVRERGTKALLGRDREG